MFERVTNPTLKRALEALQAGDKATWTSLFTDDAVLYDDGRPRDLQHFTDSALGHERFTHIDEVKAGGLEVYGNFHSDQWGDFRTYFKFTLDSEGKITQLDIGQA